MIKCSHPSLCPLERLHALPFCSVHWFQLSKPDRDRITRQDNAVTRLAEARAIATQRLAEVGR